MNRARAENTSRMPGLDLLRAIAILWVMYYHAVVFDFVAHSDPIARSGWMGVDLFFGLSGFLIGSQLLRPLARGDRINVGRFYLRRMFRTLPTYLVVVALYFTFPAIREAPQIAPLWRFLTFTQNLFSGVRHTMALSHAWSLCVEEQFYLIAPLAAWILMWRPSARRTIVVCTSILLGGILLRALIWKLALAPLVDSRHELLWRWRDLIYYPIWSRLDGLLAGIVVALIETFRPKTWQLLMKRGNAILAAALVVLVIAILIFRDQIDFMPSTIGFPILASAVGGLVAAGASSSSLIGRRAIPGAGFIAAMAYSLYLTHKSVFHLVAMNAGDTLKPHPFLSVIIYGAAAMIVGALFYAAIERPSLIVRERVLRARAPSFPQTTVERLAPEIR